MFGSHPKSSKKANINSRGHERKKEDDLKPQIRLTGTPVGNSETFGNPASPPSAHAKTRTNHSIGSNPKTKQSERWSEHRRTKPSAPFKLLKRQPEPRRPQSFFRCFSSDTACRELSKPTRRHCERPTPATENESAINSLLLLSSYPKLI